MNAERFPGVVAAAREGRILADNAAGTQVPYETVDAVRAYLAERNAQQGIRSSRQRHTGDVLAEAHATFAELLGVEPADVGFGANATSISYDLARTLAHAIRPGDRIVVTAADHYANVVPWLWLRNFGAVVDVVDVDAVGDLDRRAFEHAIEREPLLVALPWSSNVTGTVFDVAELSRAASEAGALVVVDGVQAAPHAPLTIPETVDAAFFSLYKIFGPHVGAWYARPEMRERFFVAEDPFLPSAPLLWSMETGTQSFEGLAGWLGTAAYLRDVGGGDLRAAMARIAADEAELVRAALAGFAERKDRLVLLGHPERDRAPVFAFNVRGAVPAEISTALDAAGIEQRVGDHYAPRLLYALAPEFNRVAVRVSFAHYNSLDDVGRCFAALDAVVERTALSAG